MVTLAQWVLRTLTGTVVGACVAHAQEVQLAFSKASEQRYFVVSGGQMAFVKGASPPSSGLWINILGAWCGAALAGHMATDLLLVFWGSSLWNHISSSFSSLGLSWWVMGLGPIFAKIAGLVLGIVLALKLRLRSNLSGITTASLLSLGLTFVLAAGASHITWVLQDLTQRSSAMVDVMEEYPSVKKSLALPDGDSHVAPTAAQCAHATALFSLVEERWIAAARAHAEPVPLLLLNGLGSSLWRHGCWTDAHRLAAHQKLEQAAMWSGAAQRRLAIQLPQLRAGNQEVVQGLSLTRAKWCVSEAMKITADQASPSKAGEVCGAIPQAQASVHEAGIYTLTTQDLAVLGRAGP